MIIARTPFRISFSGGGTDLESFYQREEGSVLSTSINKYMYITVHPYCLKDHIQVKYSKTELVKNVAEIEHPIVREVLLKLKMDVGLEIVSMADVPAGTGIASSSAFTVCLLHCLNAYLGNYVSKEYLASVACDIEINRLGEPIGKQDQYASAFGGLNLIKFGPNGNVRVDPVIMKSRDLENLEDNLILFYTGRTRRAHSILKEQNDLTKTDKKTFTTLKMMAKQSLDMHKLLSSGQLDDFGYGLHEGWKLKKSLTDNISNSELDELYERGIKFGGALGGKLLGAGGGGYLLFYCKKENQEKLRIVFSELEELPFKFERNGSHIIFFENNQMHIGASQKTVSNSIENKSEQKGPKGNNQLSI
jgi:D-glycero-alpha-D-manno-heptose-7-phosphate kinase